MGGRGAGASSVWLHRWMYIQHNTRDGRGRAKSEVTVRAKNLPFLGPSVFVFRFTLE